MSLHTLFRRLRANYHDTSWWLRVASPRYGLVRAYFLARDDPENGVEIVYEDWDNLVILDACRYDMFAELNTLTGELRKRRSRASSTGAFLNQNFGDGTYHDIVYVTANPQVNIVLEADALFHDVINVWESGWNEDCRTVMPETMVNAAREAHERYPNKRIIAHFVQPHYPFIGERARGLLPEQRGFERGRDEVLTGNGRVEAASVWTRLRKGEIDRETVHELYNENLEVVLEALKPLLATFQGRTVVTSDHGNMIGEFAWPFPFRIYGHPEIRTDKLVEVPWLVVEGDGRKEIFAEPPVAAPIEDNESMAQTRLADLGYVDE